MSISRWYKFALFNLIILALMGVLLRYKIAFALPFIEQKNLLHAHSHFAFSGWVGFMLQLIIIDLFRGIYKGNTTFWNKFLLISTIINYGMLFAFAWQGYGPVSITISTISILLSYVYAVLVFLSLKNANNTISIKFVKAALVFLALSSIGPFALAYMMATHFHHIYWSHNALYWFLHFQYNGWFVFAILGIFFYKIESSSVVRSRSSTAFYRLMLFSFFPAYFLVIMLYHRPLWITITNFTTAILQAIALALFVGILIRNSRIWTKSINPVSNWLILISFLAFGLKICLQFFSAHPEIGQLAYSFRPIVIGYLHLVFLVFATLFILSHLSGSKSIKLDSTVAVSGLISFVLFVIINETLLAYQGIASIIGSVNIVLMNKLLFINTIFILLSSILIFSGSRLLKK